MDRHAPTLEEVAAAAGVSRSTASRVINGAIGVAEHTKEAVESAIESLGYVPNRAARSLVTRRTGSIALVIPESDDRILTDPFFAATLKGVHDALGEAEVQLVLLIAPKERVPRIGQYLKAGHVDGAIVVSHHNDDGLEEALVASRLPAYFVGRPYQPLPGVRFVDVDNVAGARIATEHLVARGARRIVTITGPLDMTAAEDRASGWRQALAAAGVTGLGSASGDFTVQGGAEAMSALLETHPDLDGVFAASDQMAAGALQVLAAAGKRVPQDVALVGFDNLGIPETTKPRLTTVHNPVREMAQTVTRRLLARVFPGHDQEPVEDDAITESGSVAQFEPYLVAGESA